MKRRNLLVMLVLVTLISMNGVLAFSEELTEYYDIQENWSKGPLERAVENGLLKGDSGRIRGEENLTRAEMATIINRAFNVENKAFIGEFTDISIDEWYYEEMQKAVHMKSFKGNGKKLNPKKNISREEAFVVLARCFKLDGNYEEDLSDFSDRENISDWAKESLIALVSNGYIAGSEGELKPDKNIARAEFAKLMDSLISNYIVKEGKYSQDFNGNLMINRDGVILKDSTIRGDLIIGDGVGSGDIILDHIIVEGRLLVRGGGENSVIIRGDSKIDNVLTGKNQGKLRIKTEETNIKNIVLDCEDDIILEGDFENLLIKGNNIQIDTVNSNIEKAKVDGKNIKLNFINNSKVNGIELDEKSENIEIKVDKTVEIAALKVNSEGTIISGEGKINKLENNSRNLKSYLLSKELVKKDRDKSSKKYRDKSDENEQEIKPIEPEKPIDPGDNDGTGEIEDPEESDGETEAPVIPVEPDNPSKPIDPDDNDGMEDIEEPEIPAIPDEPDKPWNPVEPDDNNETGETEKPEESEEEKEDPVIPDDPDKPLDTVDPDDNDETGGTEEPEESDKEKETPTIRGSIITTEMKGGDKLLTSKLSGDFINKKGDVITGELNWVNGDKNVNESGEYEWSFIPNDIEKYNIIQGTVRVEVIPVVLVSNQDELANAIKEGKKYIKFERGIVAYGWKEINPLHYNVKGGEIDLNDMTLTVLEKTFRIQGEDILIKNGEIKTAMSYPIIFNGKNTTMDNIKYKGSVYLIGRWKNEEISGFNEYSLTIKNSVIEPNYKENKSNYNIIKIDGNGNGSVIVNGSTLKTKNNYAFHIRKKEGNSIIIEEDVSLELNANTKIYDENDSKEPIIKCKVER